MTGNFSCSISSHGTECYCTRAHTGAWLCYQEPLDKLINMHRHRCRHLHAQENHAWRSHLQPSRQPHTSQWPDPFFMKACSHVTSLSVLMSVPRGDIPFSKTFHSQKINTYQKSLPRLVGVTAHPSYLRSFKETRADPYSSLNS